MVDRRIVLSGIAAGVLAAAGAVVAGARVGDGFYTTTAATAARPGERERFVPRIVPEHPAAAEPVPYYFPTPNLTKVPVSKGSLVTLSGKGNSIALTVDDGGSSETVRLYVEFAKRTGMRLTFFPNGSLPSWTENAALLRPLVESGQIQLGNHTWSHPDLTKLSDARIQDELGRNDEFLTRTYGVSPKPYFRPPYGFHNAHVDAVAAAMGYTVPVLWYGSLSDSGLITEDQLKGFATQWMLPQHIVIGHANFTTVTNCFDFLVDLMRSRGLQPVTLNDYFLH